MYVAVVPNRDSPPAILLRESYRQAGKVKTRTLANLSQWPPERIDRLRILLSGKVDDPPRSFEIIRSLPHGHVAAVIGTIRKLDLARLISRKDPNVAALCMAMIASRILSPGSKLFTARMMDSATCAHRLWARSSACNTSTKTLCTERWTFCSNSNHGSNRLWPAGTSTRDRWFSTT